jgi:hypothetical protein
MANFFLAAIASLAVAVDDQAASAPAPRELRQSISEALRREATTTGPEHEQALRKLVAVFEQLAADRQLPEKERDSRIGQVRARLARGADQLQLAQRVGAGPRQAAGNGNAVRATGGAAGRNGAGAPQGANDDSDQLIDLIQRTIAPGSWEANGGRGTIMYFPAKQVLVIRQTGEVHDQFRDLLQQLRR